MTYERAVAGGQGAYWLLTGAVPLVSRRAFEAVTGPKPEWWLVQTVAGLVCTVGAALVSGALKDRVTPELRLAAAGGAGVLLAVDVSWVARGRISPVFLLDAAVEAAWLAVWARSSEGGPAT